jgi:hypothetical protein
LRGKSAHPGLFIFVASGRLEIGHLRGSLIAQSG